MTVRPDTTTCYRVTYAAAGCLPDEQARYFDDIDEMRDAVREEYHEVADQVRDEASLYGADASGILSDEALDEALLAGAIPDPAESSTYAWTIETLERNDEPSNAHLAWVCDDCISHAANGERGDCHDDMEGTHEPLALLEVDGQHVTFGMFPIHHADDCPARYGEVDVECDCEVTTFSHDRCDGCGELPGDRHAVTVWVEVSTSA